MLSMIEKRLVPAKILIKDAPDTDFSGYPTNSNSRIQDNGTSNQQFAKPKANYFLTNTTFNNWTQLNFSAEESFWPMLEKT